MNKIRGGSSQYIIEESRLQNKGNRTNQKVKLDKAYLSKLGLIYLVFSIIVILFN